MELIWADIGHPSLHNEMDAMLVAIIVVLILKASVSPSVTSLHRIGIDSFPHPLNRIHINMLLLRAQ